MEREDSIRPKGCVEVECTKCEWSYWVHCTDASLPSGPFVCMMCNGQDDVREKES